MMYSYLKYLIFILIVVFGFLPKSFSYFDDKMYCHISKDRIIISLSDTNVYRCKVYIRYIEVQMKKVYIDVLLIQKYVDKKQDLGYRKPLRDEKQEFLDKLQGLRLNIISHMKNFELNLFETSKAFFLDSISDYQQKLSRSLGALIDLDDPSGKKYIDLIEEQLIIIEKISQSANFKELDRYIQRYVYLKQLLPGK